MNLFSQSARKRPQEIVGLDFGSTGVKAVRLRKVGGQISLVAADIFSAGGGEGALVRPELGKVFSTNYAALAFSASGCVVRVVAQQGTLHGTPESERHARSQIGLDDSFRLMSVASGQQASNKGKAESRVLAVGVPDADALKVLGLFHDKAPAPWSLEVSGLASLNAAVLGPVAEDPEAPVCLLDCGARVSMMVFLNKGAVILARKLDVGAEAVVERVKSFMGVEREMAESIMSEGAIDISPAVREVSEPFLRQLMISRDFVERQENCRVGKILITGGMALSGYWLEELRRATGMIVSGWDPLKGLDSGGQGFPKVLEGQACRFSAAIGAARCALEDA